MYDDRASEVLRPIPTDFKNLSSSISGSPIWKVLKLKSPPLFVKSLNDPSFVIYVQSFPEKLGESNSSKLILIVILLLLGQ